MFDVDYAVQIPTQLAHHLRALRRAKGLTQAELGRRIGVGQVRIAAIEKNPAAISVEQFLYLLAALDTKIILRPSP